MPLARAPLNAARIAGIMRPGQVVTTHRRRLAPAGTWGAEYREYAELSACCRDLAEAEAEAAAGRVHADDAGLDGVTFADHLAGMRDPLGGQLGDVDQALYPGL